MDGKIINVRLCTLLFLEDSLDCAMCTIYLKKKKKYCVSFSSSSLVNHILCEAFEKLQRKFRVIVVDSRPRLEGREALRRLVKRGIRCTYVLISALPYILPEARNHTKK